MTGVQTCALPISGQVRFHDPAGPLEGRVSPSQVDSVSAWVRLTLSGQSRWSAPPWGALLGHVSRNDMALVVSRVIVLGARVLAEGGKPAEAIAAAAEASARAAGGARAAAGGGAAGAKGAKGAKVALGSGLESAAP